MAGAPVRLDENRGIANDVFGFVGAVFTLGLSCVAGADPCRASGGAASAAEADGVFRFDAAAVERARGRSNGVILSAGSEAAGGLRVELDPTLGGDLGDLALWEPKVRAGADGYDVRFEATAPPGADGRTEVDAAVLDAQRRSVVQTTQTGPEVSFVVDRRAYEDGPGTVVLTSGFSRPRAGQNPRIDWTSAPVRVGPGAGAPLSRGRPCTTDLGGRGRVAPTGCPLTDGDLVTDAVPGLRSGVIDLGAPRPLRLIAVRQVVETVEISTDGQAYMPLNRATNRRAAWSASLYDAAGTSARFVRITVIQSGTTQAGGPAEVSVWAADAKPPEAAAAPSGDLSTVTAGSPAPAPIPMADPLDASPRPGGVLIAGLVALGLLLVVLGFAGGVALSRRA